MTLLWPITYKKSQKHYIEPFKLSQLQCSSLPLTKYALVHYYNRLKSHIQLSTFSSEQQLIETLQSLIIPDPIHTQCFQELFNYVLLSTKEFCVVDFWLSYDSCVHSLAQECEEREEDTTVFKVQFTRFINSLDKLTLGDMDGSANESSITSSKNIRKILKYWLGQFQLLFRQYPDHDYLNLFVGILCEKFNPLIRLFETQIDGVFIELTDDGVEKLHIPGFMNVLHIMRQIIVSVQHCKYFIPETPTVSTRSSFTISSCDMSLDGIVHSTPNSSFSSKSASKWCSFCGGHNHYNKECPILKHFLRFNVLTESYNKSELIIKDFNGNVFNFSTVPNVQCPRFQTYINKLGLD